MKTHMFKQEASTMNQIQALELHLFFDRIMMEHSLFLAAGFPSSESQRIQIALNFHQTFSQLLQTALELANNQLSSGFLNAQEIVTPHTLQAEQQTSQFLGIPINTQITQQALHLRSGNTFDSPALTQQLHQLNQASLHAVTNLIQFKEETLNSVLQCSLFTVNYPLLISHILHEAKLYHTLLCSLENNATVQDIFQQYIFWDNIMMEHAAFIRGLLDPSEDSLIQQANQFVSKYHTLLTQCPTSPYEMIQASLENTLQIRDFKIAGEEGILNCKIKSIIIPLLADHVVREANHFIRLLTTTN